MTRRGFSVVELAIVIALIGVVSLLLFASLRGSQVSARDDERHAKAESIARSFEQLYKSGNSDQNYSSGSYPSVGQLSQAISANTIAQLLPGVDSSTLSFSWASDQTPKLKPIVTTSESVNHNNTELTSFVNGKVALDEFVYEPLVQSANFSTDSDLWQYCRPVGEPCRRFNIYYRTEADNVVHTIRSTNQ